MDDWTIRPEQPADHAQIRELTIAAFAAAFGGTGLDEAELIEELRSLPGHDPALALVAVGGAADHGAADHGAATACPEVRRRDGGGLVVGHVMLSPVTIRGEGVGVCAAGVWPALCLAPLGVRIGHQRQGIGSALMRAVLAAARARGHTRVVLSGSERYYPRFGFQDAERLGLRDDLGTPSPHFLTLALVEGAFDGVAGVVCYPPTFDRFRATEG